MALFHEGFDHLQVKLCILLNNVCVRRLCGL